MTTLFFELDWTRTNSVPDRASYRFVFLNLLGNIVMHWASGTYAENIINDCNKYADPILTNISV